MEDDGRGCSSCSSTRAISMQRSQENLKITERCGCGQLADQPFDRAMNRRLFLVAGASVLIASRVRGDQVPEDDEEGLRDVESRAKEVGIGPFRTTRTAHYAGIGDAADRFRKDA